MKEQILILPWFLLWDEKLPQPQAGLCWTKKRSQFLLGPKSDKPPACTAVWREWYREPYISIREWWLTFPSPGSWAKLSLPKCSFSSIGRERRPSTQTALGNVFQKGFPGWPWFDDDNYFCFSARASNDNDCFGISVAWMGRQHHDPLCQFI